MDMTETPMTDKLASLRDQALKLTAERDALRAERDKLQAELTAVTARSRDSRLQPSEVSDHPETGDDLLDRLRGIYTVPVNDGAGLLDGKSTFTRRFPTLAINVEAAARIEKLEQFKAYVHARLDAAGVPADPESPHKAEGCRIGGRLDIVLAAFASPVEQRPVDPQDA